MHDGSDRQSNRAPLRVAIFDDMVAARGETFNIPGLAVDVYPHADDAVALCEQHGYDVVFMDFAMGAEHDSGAAATSGLRGAGYAGTIVAISSDPAANKSIQTAGANEVIGRKAHLRSYLVHLGQTHLAGDSSDSSE
ncbi:MAG: response regulator [Myxococcota bacterium]